MWKWDDSSVSSEIDRVTETSFDDDSDCHINPDIRSDYDVDTADTESGPPSVSEQSQQSKIHTSSV